MRIRVLKYFHIDLAGNIAEMCGTDSVLPFRDERRSVMSNIKLAEKHTEFMIKKGAVAVQAFHWRGLNNDTPIGDMVYLVSDKVVNRQKQRYTKTDIVPIGVTIEYKDWYFAEVYVVRRGAWSYGYYYEDKLENKKWFTISVPSVFHPYFKSTLEELRCTCFGEDCIYAHSILAVDTIINRLIELDTGYLPVNLNQCSYDGF